MFTGIVQSTGQVKLINEGDNFKRFVISVPLPLLDKLQTGASIANNGVCLTVVAFSKVDEDFGEIEFDVIDETLRLTNLNDVVVTDFVNVERSMKAGDEIGGHIVSGHIHSTATLIERLDSKNNCQLKFSIAGCWSKYLFGKGFIAVNGASLTLGEVIKTEPSLCEFYLHLIPETLSITNLDTLLLGKTVNIEIDQQTKTIVDSIDRIMAEKLSN